MCLLTRQVQKRTRLLCSACMSCLRQDPVALCVCVQASFNMSLVEFELVSVAAVQAEKPREANGTALARTTADGNAE